MADSDSIVLRFFVGPNGELQCRAIDIYTRRTWIVPGAREVRRLLHIEPEFAQAGIEAASTRVPQDDAHVAASDAGLI